MRHSVKHPLIMRFTNWTLPTLFTLLCVAASLHYAAGAPAKESTASSTKDQTHAKKASELFAGIIPTLNLRIDPKAMDQLRKDPRSYIEASIEEAGAKTHEHLAIKLKGAAGSFQGIDARPGFTVSTSKFKGGDRFHGLKHFHLNNCAQDNSALNELMSGEMARAAGVPASRCTHALVSLNGKDLGIYVLKEGFTEDFLAHFFKRTDGHLYDEIHDKMALDQGGESNKEGFFKLLAALKQRDAKKQNEMLSAIVDVDAYLRYLVLENVLCHWDGYSFNRNNYRFYENPETGRFHFFLHGMDQMFTDPGQTIQRDPGGFGAILWRQPEMRPRYLAQFMDIYNKVLRPVDWPARAGARGRLLMAALKPEVAKKYEPRISEARNRIAERLRNICRQVEGPRLINTLVTKGRVELHDSLWTAQDENADTKEITEEGIACLHIKAKGDTHASWLASFTLPAGKFRFEARLKTRGVVPLPSKTGEGAGVRVSGGSRQGQKSLAGDTKWQDMSYEIDSPGRDYSLVAELRARAGEMWIDRKSLRIVKVP